MRPLTRRTMLGGAASVLLAPLVSCTESGEGEYQVAAAGASLETYGVAIYRARDASVRVVPTGFRGHGLTARKDRPREVVMFGRRPGSYAAVVDVVEAELSAKLVPPANRRFQGHGEFTFDHRILLTSEEDPETGQGFIGLYDARDYRRLGEHATGGVGPHELRLLPDGQTVVVANAGLRTGADPEALAINLSSMHSSLAYVSLSSGAVLESVRVREPKSSLRHLGLADDGTVVVGAQVQRSAVGHDEVIPLAAVHRRGGALRELEGAPELIAELNDYIGSVAIAPGSRVACVTSPRGNLALVYDFDSGEVIGSRRLTDVCGAAGAPGGRFVITASTGVVETVEAVNPGQAPRHPMRFPDIRWDNHLLTVVV